MLLTLALERFYASMDGVLSPSTVLFYRNRLPSMVTYLGDVEISTIDLDQLRAWRSSLAHKSNRWGLSRPVQAGGYSVWTLHQYVRSAKRFFRWLELEGLIMSNQARRLELPRLPKPVRRGISQADRDKIIQAAYRSGPRDYAMCRLLADTACRVGGLANLMMTDLELDLFRAIVREKGRGGEAKERWVFYGLDTARSIRDYLAVRPSVGHNGLFLSKTGKQITTWGIREMLERLARSVGVMDGENPHNWRHGAIRGMLRNGMSLAAASQIAGHASVTVTADLYGTFSETELADMHHRYSWLEDSYKFSLGEMNQENMRYTQAETIDTKDSPR